MVFRHSQPDSQPVKSFKSIKPVSHEILKDGVGAGGRRASAADRAPPRPFGPGPIGRREVPDPPT